MLLAARERIDAFYQHKRIAVIGVSRDRRKYGHRLFEALLHQGYDAVAVNPEAERIGGRPCYRSLAELPEPVEVAIAVVPPTRQEEVVEACVRAGVKRLWLHEQVMKAARNPRVLALCEAHGIELITGYCPFMFMPGAGFPHNLHGWIVEITKAQPK